MSKPLQIPEDFQRKFDLDRAVELSIKDNKYIPDTPTPRQLNFLLREEPEALFGGAAGGGKSIALLMAALQYVDRPRYRALLLRRSYADLRLPGALIDVADSWLGPTDAERKNSGLEWHFPSGAKLTFGHMGNEQVKFRYASAAFHFVGFDELTHFRFPEYRFMFSRVRRQMGDSTPLRTRAATNPGSVGHNWVKGRFITQPSPRRIFVPSLGTDNPHLDMEEYRTKLRELSPVERRQLEHGDWNVSPSGNVYAVNMIPVIEGSVEWTHPAVQRVRAWDLAATDKAEADWCVGALVAYHPLLKRYAVEDVVRVQQDPGVVDATLGATARRDGNHVTQVVEQEPGSASKIAMRYLRTEVFDGLPAGIVRPTGNKMNRARLGASLVAAGDVEVRIAAWTDSFLDELRAFPQDGMHDDQVDAFSHGIEYLAKLRGVGPPMVPTGSREAHTGGATPQTQRRINR